MLPLALLLSAPVRVYVSPQGSDTWSGRLPRPNRSRTDGPFATLERAREEVRRIKRERGMPPGGIEVVLRGGVYRLAGTFVLTKEDGGEEGAPVVYKALPGERPRIVGGARLDPSWFRPVSDPAALRRLPEGARGKVLCVNLREHGVEGFGELRPFGFGKPIKPRPLEVFFDGEPLTLARWPNEGYARVAKVLGRKAFVLDDPRVGRWAGVEGFWAHGFWFHEWADEALPVRSVDPEGRTITLAVGPHYGIKRGARFYVFNLLEELDSPGEWYLDRGSGLLYLRPPKPIEGAEIWASTLEGPLFRLEGTSHVTIEGLTFEVCRGNGIEVAGGDHNRIKNCVVRNVGNTGIVIEGGSRNGVEGCEVYNTGDGGVRLGGGDRRTLTPAGNYVVDCDIHHFSRLSKTYRPAVLVWGVGNSVAHNEIHDAPHCGILFSGNEHRIEFNVLHHLCWDTSDVGAIYTGRDWTYRGNLIRFNFFHHIRAVDGVGAQGVYIDDMASGMTIFGNVFYKVQRAILIGGGRDNIVENNVIVECQVPIHIDARGLGWARGAAGPGGVLRRRLEAVPYTKEPWRSRYPQLLTILQDDPGAPKYNVVRRNVIVKCGKMAIHEAARRFGTIGDNFVTGEDPGFVDPARLNFSLRPNSIVFKRVPGFKPIPFGKIGRRRGGGR